MFTQFLLVQNRHFLWWNQIILRLKQDMNHFIIMIKWNNKYMCMQVLLTFSILFFFLLLLSTCTTTLCALQFNKKIFIITDQTSVSFKPKQVIVHYWHYQCVCSLIISSSFLMDLIPSIAFLQVRCVVRWRRNSPRVLVCPGNTAWQNSHTWDCSMTSDMNSPPAWLTNSLSRKEDDQGLCGTEKHMSDVAYIVVRCSVFSKD